MESFDLKNIPLFSELSDGELELISKELEMIKLAEGEWLFHENDPGDALFILLEGKLVTIIGHQKHDEASIGTIKAGEVVGELSIFSHARRSASVKALTDSVLLRLNGEKFHALCIKNPQLLWDITRLIAHRAQVTLRPTAKNQIIALINICDQSNVQDLRLKLETMSPFNIRFIDANNLKSIDHITHQELVIVAFLNYNDLENNCELLKICDKVIVMIVDDNGNHIAALQSRIADIENKAKHIEKELLLLHSENRAVYANTGRYTSLGSFARCYHLALNSQSSTMRFLRFIHGNPIGLVVSGGGARAFSALGVIRVFYEYGIDIDWVGGTSGGAVAGAAYVTTVNQADYEYIAKEVSWNVRNPFSLKHLTFPLMSIFSGRNMTHSMQSSCRDIMIEDLAVPFFCMTVNLSKKNEYVWDSGPLWKALRATVSVPALVPPFVHNNEIHVDGGLMNNFPVDVMRKKLGPRGRLWGIDGGSAPQDFKKYDFPPTVGIMEALKMKLSSEKKYMGIYEILLQSVFTSSTEKYMCNVKKLDLSIKPKLDNYTFSDFKKLNEIIDLGYQEAKVKLQNLKTVSKMRRFLSS